MKKMKNNSGYSVIIALLIIGFLLVLTTGIFNLVLKEQKDNRAMGNYIKAYAGAESAQELALLQIKKLGYGFDEKINADKTKKSIILSNNPLNSSKYKGSQDVMISYEIGSKISEFTNELDGLSYDILPLFYIKNDGTEEKLSEIELNIISGDSLKLAWNILGKNGGISSVGEIDSITEGHNKNISSGEFSYSKINVNTFLSSSDTNYLIIYNVGNNTVKYKIKGLGSQKYFSKPRTNIISSAQVGGYKQNLSTLLDNTKFLGFLKYSIYSN